MPVTLTIDIERETDGRWLAEVPELPGVLAYGSTEAAAVDRCGGDRPPGARRSPRARRGGHALFAHLQPRDFVASRAVPVWQRHALG